MHGGRIAMRKKIIIAIIMIVVGLGCSLFCMIPSRSKQMEIVKRYIKAVEVCDIEALQEIVADNDILTTENLQEIVTIEDCAEVLLFDDLIYSNLSINQIKEIRAIKLINIIVEEDNVAAVIKMDYKNLDEKTESLTVIKKFTFTDTLGGLKIKL